MKMQNRDTSDLPRTNLWRLKKKKNVVDAGFLRDAGKMQFQKFHNSVATSQHYHF